MRSHVLLQRGPQPGEVEQSIQIVLYTSFTSFLSGMSCCWNWRATHAFKAHSTAYPAR